MCLATFQVKLSSAFAMATAKKEGGKKHVAPKSSATTLPSGPSLKLPGFILQGQRHRPLWASSTNIIRLVSSLTLRIYHGCKIIFVYWKIIAHLQRSHAAAALQLSHT